MLQRICVPYLQSEQRNGCRWRFYNLLVKPQYNTLAKTNGIHSTPEFLLLDLALWWLMEVSREHKIETVESCFLRWYLWSWSIWIGQTETIINKWDCCVRYKTERKRDHCRDMYAVRRFGIILPAIHAKSISLSLKYANPNFHPGSRCNRDSMNLFSFFSLSHSSHQVDLCCEEWHGSRTNESGESQARDSVDLMVNWSHSRFLVVVGDLKLHSECEFELIVSFVSFSFPWRIWAKLDAKLDEFYSIRCIK